MPNFIGEIVQSGGDFALLDSSNIRGGFTQVATIKERDSIVPDKLKEHMFVHVAEDGQIYEYIEGTWVLYSVNASVRMAGYLSEHHRVLEITEDSSHPDCYKITLDCGYNDKCFFVGRDIIGGYNWNFMYDNCDKAEVVEVVEPTTEDKLWFCYIKKNNTPPKKNDIVYRIGSTDKNSLRASALRFSINDGVTAFMLYKCTSTSTLNSEDGTYFQVGGVLSNDKNPVTAGVFKGTFLDRNTEEDIGTAALSAYREISTINGNINNINNTINEVKDSVANVKTTAEQALETSRVAGEEAGNATTKANQANTKADKAITDSKAASDKATEAVNKATDATNTANIAEQTANTANETAGQAMTKSTQALEKSGQAIEDAKNSLSEAQTAHTLAENAQNTANANAKKLAGITLKPISETEYEALETKENDTLYLCYDPSVEP